MTQVLLQLLTIIYNLEKIQILDEFVHSTFFLGEIIILIGDKIDGGWQIIYNLYSAILSQRLCSNFDYLYQTLVSNVQK